MEKEYWLNKWQSKDIAFHEQNINLDLIAYIQTLNLHPGDYIFVPLCGKAKDMIWLAMDGNDLKLLHEWFQILHILKWYARYEKYLRIGFASVALALFTNFYLKRQFTAALVDPLKENTATISFFERNGFKHILSQNTNHDLMLLKLE
jgi:hypothetical protein